MGKVDELAAQAFVEGHKFRRDNTHVRISTRDTGETNKFLYLQGNNIAAKVAYLGEVYLLRDAGWLTNTTKNRLNAILERCDDDRRIHGGRNNWRVLNIRTGDVSPWDGRMVTGTDKGAVMAERVKHRLNGGDVHI